MKKLIVLLILPVTLVVLSFFLIAKKHNKKISQASEISTSFDGTVKVNLDGKLYECGLKHTPERMNTLEIMSPKELEGLTFVWEGEKCMVIWKDLTCELNKEFLPQSAFAETLVNIFNLLSDGENLKLESGPTGESIFSGRVASGDFKIKIGKDGEIKTVSVPDMKLEAEFFSEKK